MENNSLPFVGVLHCGFVRVGRSRTIGTRRWRRLILILNSRLWLFRGCLLQQLRRAHLDDALRILDDPLGQVVLYRALGKRNQHEGV